MRFGLYSSLFFTVLRRWFLLVRLVCMALLIGLWHRLILWLCLSLFLLRGVVRPDHRLGSNSQCRRDLCQGLCQGLVGNVCLRGFTWRVGKRFIWVARSLLVEVSPPVLLSQEGKEGMGVSAPDVPEPKTSSSSSSSTSATLQVGMLFKFFSKSDLHLSQTFTFLGLCWDTVCMSVSLPPDKLADIQQLAFSLLQTTHLTVCRVMSFLGKANFCTNGHSQLCHLCHVIQHDMLHVYHSPMQLFSCVHLSLFSLCQLEWLANLQQSPIPLQFPLPDVVIATDAIPTHWAFYFQGSALPLSVSGAWSGSLCRVHITLQELHAVAIMLYRMAFYLSGKGVALHLDNSTAKADLCNQGGTVSPFLSRLACWILSLTDKHTFLPTSMWRQIICPGISCFWSGTFSLRWLRQLFTFGAFQRWTCWLLLILLNASIISLWKLHCLWGPWGWMPSAILGLFR